MIRVAIKNNFRTLQQVTESIIKASFAFLPTPLELTFTSYLDERFNLIFRSQTSRLAEKLERQQPPQMEAHLPPLNPVVNLTDTPIPSPVAAILAKGSKFNLNVKHIPYVDILAPLESQLRHHPEFNDGTRHKIARLLSAAKHTGHTGNAADAAGAGALKQFLRQNNNILLLRSDKG